MRLVNINSGEDLVGKVATNSIGRVAVITGTRTFEWGDAYVGLGLDGKGTWSSIEACIVAESSQEFHDKLLERFDGKMSNLG